MKIFLTHNSLVSSFAFILLLFSSCTAQTADSKNKNESENLPLLEYCELRNNPDKYDGKIVRLKAEINGGQHGDHLYDERCPADPSIYAYYDATAAVFYKNREDNDKVRKIRDQRLENENSEKRWTDAVNVTVIGIFKKNKPTKNDSSYERNATFHFTINSIESFSEDN